MEKPILKNDFRFTHNGKQLIVGVREWDTDEINMVLGEVLNETTFDQTWSSGYDRGHIESEQQFCQEVFAPWCNRWVQDKYGPFTGIEKPLEWWELIAVYFHDNVTFDPNTGFTVA